jgi:polar amino acid transport system substrate-binding protein
MNPEEFLMLHVGKITAIGFVGWVLMSFQPAYATCDSTGLAAKYPSLVGRTVRLAQDGESPPYTFRDPANLEVMKGLDYELATATFACLGMKTEIKIGKWSGLLPAVIAGQADVMWNNLYYTPARVQQVDFVTYLVASTGGLVRTGNPKKISALSDTCGMRGAAGLGTVEEMLLRKTSDECVAAGKPALEIATYPDKPSGTRLVQSGRADIMLSDGGFVGNMVKNDGGEFAQAFTIKSNFKVGPGITRTIPELRQAIADALAQLQADGTIQTLMTKHGVDPSLMLPVESFTN